MSFQNYGVETIGFTIAIFSFALKFSIPILEFEIVMSGLLWK